MNANVKKWVKALRSGKYKQGRKCLRSVNNKFCCLGVACDLYMAERGGLSVEVNANKTHYLYSGWENTLPTRVSNWLGMRLGHQDELIRLNDRQKASFAKIADYIESHPGLFEEQI